MSIGPLREAPRTYAAPGANSDVTRAGSTQTPAPSATSAPSPFARLVHGLGHEVSRGETTMRAALHASSAGRDLGPTELLALQAGVYRYSEAVDLASKLVDRATGGVKTVLQGQ